MTHPTDPRSRGDHESFLRRPCVHRTATAALILGLVGIGLAGRGRSDAHRANERMDLAQAEDSPVEFRRGLFKVKRKGLGNQHVKILLAGGTPDFDVDVLVADADGTLTDVGDMDRRGRSYRWRLNSKKGDALPFGAADVAALSGREVELRTSDGDLVATGTWPEIEEAPPVVARRRPVNLGLAVDEEAVADLAAADEVEAQLKLRDRGRDREEFRAQIEGLVTGLTLEVWLVDGDGVESLIGTATEDEDDEGEYKLRFRTDKGDELPLGVDSLSELAGLEVEIRTTDGTVLASGVVPSIADTDEVRGRGAGAPGGGGDAPRGRPDDLPDAADDST